MILLAFGLPPTPGGADDPGKRPEEILGWRHRILPQEDYVRLASEWEGYAREHPADVHALVQWGNALRYAGKSQEAMVAYTRAFQADSTDAAATVAYASQCEIQDDSGWRLDHARLLRARDSDPTYPVTYYTLWRTALRAGDHALVDDCLKRMVSLGDMPRPLYDFGYNILAGAPEGAIILTNGDNDTYPPLAVQVNESFRTDVRIVNLSLLNLGWYVRAMRDTGVPIPLTDSAIAALKHKPDETISTQVQKGLYAEEMRRGSKPPLFYTVTVSDQNRVLPEPHVLVGVLERIGPPPAEGRATGEPPFDLQETKQLFDRVYRLDSITDPSIPWDRESALRKLALNYVELLSKVGIAIEQDSTRGDGSPYLSKAIAIATFHHRLDIAQQLLERWQKLDGK